MFPDMSCDDIFRLETPRLWLRWLRAGDAAAVRAFASRAEIAQMTASIPHPYPPREAERFILHARATTAAGDALVLAITLKNKARTLVGIVGAQTSDLRETEIGYVVAPAYAGRGYATEATAAMVEAVFNLTEVRSITAKSRVINPASRRVLEKCGFESIGTKLADLPARGGQHPCDHFVLTRRHHASRHRERGLRPMAHQLPNAGPQMQGEQSQ